jgi:hypothetical protein
MTSDRARVTYDPARRYHGVVAQQGRISLEADWNEAQAITGAELATRTLDVVGRAGSPDRGYEITPVADGDATDDLLIRAGTLYVGGQRVHLARDERYAGQPDWADHEGDPLWRDPAVPRHPHELVYLLAREQEVSAVEDPALRDVALGGPDTAQRLRILPRVVRHPTAAETWEDAWGQLVEERWRPRGFTVDEASRALLPGARLQVTAFSAGGTGLPDGTGFPGGTGQPADHGDYLGPNNQLIRVQVARVTEDGVPVLVWGYDNASFLYRLSSSVISASKTVLRLAAVPVDAYHQPREHQVIEVLRGAALLSGGGDAVAAATGRVTRVAVAYNPDTREVVADTELPPEYLKKPGEGLPLFLRVWEGEVRCTPGEDHELGGTGLRVRLTGLPASAEAADPAPEAAFPEAYPVGAYWTIAVRPGVGPGAEGVVYPQRILDRPQPPDGPRQWLTPLAFIRWRPGEPRTEDCVPRFAGLLRTDQSAGPGAIQLQPHEVGGGWGLQDAINAHASRDRAVTIGLAPGAYALPRPLRIGPEHGRLTIKASAPGVVLRAEPGAAERFLLGLVVATGADGFSLDGLEFHPPHARFPVDRDSFLNLPERARELLDAHRDQIVSIGVHAARCTGLSVERCHFVFSPPPPGEAAGPGGRPPEAGLFGAAIFSTEELRGLRVTGCTFTSREPLSHARRRPRSGEAAEGRHDAVIGLVHVPRGSLSVPVLTDAVLDGNTFTRVTAPLVAVGQLGGIRVERNTVRSAHAGFWLVTQDASHVLTLLDRLVNQVEDAYRDLVTAGLAVLAEPLLFYATALARALPLELPPVPSGEAVLSEEADDAVPRPRRLEPPSATEERDASELLHQLSAPDSPEEQRPPAPAQRENRLRRFLDTFGRARTTRAQPEEVVIPAAEALRCVLSITGNIVDSGDAPALVVLDTARDGASLVLTGNQLRGRLRPGAVVGLYRLRASAVSANVIINETDETDEGDEGWDEPSLIVRPRRHRGRHETAVTGNVLVGRAHLPHRPGEFPDWASLNSLTRW